MAQPDGHRRLLHTSDLHLGAQFPGRINSQGNAVASLAAVVTLAIEENADLLLIAGDFFDHNRVADSLIVAALEELCRLPIPAVILPGNHDCLAPDSVYRRFDFSSETGNTLVLRDPEGEEVSFPDLDIALWGRPHGSYDDFPPLTNLPPRGRERWQIAVAHGHYVRSVEDWGRAYPIRPQEVAATDRDYVALGHWDWFEAVAQGAVPAYYSGSPTWGGHTCALVDLQEGGLVVRRISVPRLSPGPSRDSAPG